MQYDANEFAEKRIFPLFMRAEPFGEYCGKAQDVIAQVIGKYVFLGLSGRGERMPGLVLKDMENVFDFYADDVSCLAEEAAAIGFELGTELKKTATPHLEFERTMARIVELGGGNVRKYRKDNRRPGMTSETLGREEASRN